MSESMNDVIEAGSAELRYVRERLEEAGEDACDRLLGWLMDDYFRLDITGWENIPTEGPALIVANHSGAWGLDAFVLVKALTRRLDRPVRVPSASPVFRFPVIRSYARKGGAIPLDPTLGMEHLTAGELVGVFPEGTSGLEKPFRDRYRLRPFSPGFAVTAVQTGAPVVPVAVIGAEEACPRLGEIPALARLFDLPFFPLTPLFPLPAKWLVTVGEPIPAPPRPESFAARSAAARGLCAEARDAVQSLVDRERARRVTPFW
ncbi:lysophospholipid acyltransferase family protein [Streptomyces sp. NBC_00347]|uniref:lysophospholipid acyltransferase family protein n=1 Tax=Streptomyces sp. NBC_00347 TaxID=2975721 RepID=UPI00224D97CE|nr:lysophospholipid acyltransferase family protein [Streptomyces sp. NBC_00347]MCX5128494.1 acyltransferase family protein [Streptomyces sp. NBC_00347]